MTGLADYDVDEDRDDTGREERADELAGVELDAAWTAWLHGGPVPAREDDKMTDVPKLAGLAEVAGLAGVTRFHALRLSRRADFPKPVQELAAGPVWRETDVQAFLEKPRTRTGRPPTLPRTQASTALAEDVEVGQWVKSGGRWYKVLAIVDIGQVAIGLNVSSTSGARHPLAIYRGSTYPVKTGGK